MKITDKRRFLRFSNEFELTMKQGDEILSYSMEDFSAGGFKIHYVEGFEIGQIVDVDIDYHCGKFVTQARVKWMQKEKGIGFEFVDIESFF